MSTNSNIWLGRTAYQLMPDRFYRKGGVPEHINGRKLKNWDDRMPDWQPDYDGEYRNLYYYGGNLKGIEAKLEYFHDLGFDMIYMTPINQSVSYHHYDVGNHFMIDPWLGNWSDFRNLCESAKKLGILIVVDLVFNHTGINSIYFQNPKCQKWYKRTKDGKLVFWWNFKEMPECDTMLKEYQDEMTRVAEKHLENGASGIRLDLGENLPREFLYAIGRVKAQFPDTIFIGEMWGIATDREDSKIFDGQLDSVMNYPLADAILRWVRYGRDGHLSYNFNRVYGEYPKTVSNILLNNIGTHDTPMPITMLVGDKMNPDVFNKRIWDIEAPWLKGERFDTYEFRRYEAEHDRLTEEQYVHGKKLLKLALVILYNIPGIPCVYQGTELADAGYKDPFNRKPYLWKNQDEEMKSFVRELGKYRKENSDILSTGEGNISIITEKVFIFERKVNEKRLIIAVNRTAEEQWINLHSNERKTVFRIGNSSMEKLMPYGCVILREN